MHISKRAALRVAVAVAAALLPLAVDPAPASAATCRTWAPYVGARQNRYGMTVHGRIPAGSMFGFRVHWGYVSRTTYSGTRPVLWRTRRTNVTHVTGIIQAPNGRQTWCSTWRRRG